jgi:hypothetical protein
MFSQLTVIADSLSWQWAYLLVTKNSVYRLFGFEHSSCNLHSLWAGVSLRILYGYSSVTAGVLGKKFSCLVTLEADLTL